MIAFDMEVWNAKSFRVLLDFTEIKAGESKLKYVWMFVSPKELKTIYDFKNSIAKKFSLPQGSFNLFVRDGLLLDSEKINILREDDTVKLQYEENQFFEEFSFKSCNQLSLIQKKDNHPDSQCLGSSKISKKRKNYEINNFVSEGTSFQFEENQSFEDCSFKSGNQLTLLQKIDDHHSDSKSFGSSKVSKKRKSDKVNNLVSEDTSFQTHKKKKRNTISDLNFSGDPVVCEVITVPDKNTSELSKSNLNSCDISFSQNISNTNEINDNSYQVNQSKYLISSNPNEIPEKNAEISEEEVNKKRKRKRKRRRKDKSKLEANSLLEVPIQAEMSVDDSVQNWPKNFDTSSDARKHIIYRSPSPPNDFNTITLSPNESVSHSELQEAEYTANILKNPCASNLDICVRKFLEEENNVHTISEVNSESVLNKTSVSPKISTPFCKNSLKSQSWSITPLQKIKNQNDEDAAVIPYEKYVALKSVPPVGTHLVFKTLELNENYCPEVTDYKEGILKSVDPNTDELEIELLKEEIKPGRTGKFEISLDAEVPPQIIKTVTLNWSALIEPRLVS